MTGACLLEMVDGWNNNVKIYSCQNNKYCNKNITFIFECLWVHLGPDPNKFGYCKHGKPI